MEKLLVQLGYETNKLVDYKSLSIKNADLQRQLEANRLLSLNRYVLPSLLLAIFLFVQALASLLITEKYGLFSLARHSFFLVMCTAWYLLHWRWPSLTLYACPTIYTVYFAFAIYFALLDFNSGYQTFYSMMESNISLGSFFLVSLVFAASFTTYLYVYLPVFFLL